MAKIPKDKYELARCEKEAFNKLYTCESQIDFREYLIKLFDKTLTLKKDENQDFYCPEAGAHLDELKKGLQKLCKVKNSLEADAESFKSELDKIISSASKNKTYPIEIMKLCDEQFEAQKAAKEKDILLKMQTKYLEEFDKHIKLYSEKANETASENFRQVLICVVDVLKEDRQDAVKKQDNFQQEYIKLQKIADEKTKISLCAIEDFNKKNPNNG